MKTKSITFVNQLKDIGANGYDSTAPGAVKLARKLAEK